jgi:hypothetical protein
MDRYGITDYTARITVEHTAGPGTATDAQVGERLATLIHEADVPTTREFVIGDDAFYIAAVAVREAEPDGLRNIVRTGRPLLSLSDGQLDALGLVLGREYTGSGRALKAEYGEHLRALASMVDREGADRDFAATRGDA